MSGFGTFRKCRNVGLESGMRNDTAALGNVIWGNGRDFRLWLEAADPGCLLSGRYRR
jgi:hypothetical protein